jgi:hypothetical protein
MEFHNAGVVNQIHLSIICPLASSCKPSFSTTFGHFLTRCVHVSLSRRSLLHDVSEFVSYKLNLLGQIYFVPDLARRRTELYKIKYDDMRTNLVIYSVNGTKIRKS